ncbi:MAG: putative addiction module antidote protein [Fibrobacter sp.]|nr:putative addiction module antidote protein [Fibrobacter sp.]
MGKVKVSDLDVADYLTTEEDVKLFLKEALAENDPVFWQHCVSTAARSAGMAKIAEKAGLNRESLYKAMKEGAHPRFETMMKILNAMGLQLALKVVPEKKVPANVVAEKRAKYKAK